MLPVSTPQILDAANRAQQEEMHTSSVGRVLTYYPADMNADIEVCVSRPLNTANEKIVYEKLGTLPKVPVVFPRTKKYSIVFPVEAGDTVLLVYSETSLAEFRAGARMGEPADTRRHSIGYPVAIPGLFPDLEPAGNATTTPGAMVLGSETGNAKIEITASGVFLGHGASQFVALAPPTQSQLDELRTKLNSLVSAYNSHTHSYNPGPSAPALTITTTSTATAATNTGAVASTMTKSL